MRRRSTADRMAASPDRGVVVVGVEVGMGVDDGNPGAPDEFLRAAVDRLVECPSVPSIQYVVSLGKVVATFERTREESAAAMARVDGSRIPSTYGFSWVVAAFGVRADELSVGPKPGLPRAPAGNAVHARLVVGPGDDGSAAAVEFIRAVVRSLAGGVDGGRRLRDDVDVCFDVYDGRRVRAVFRKSVAFLRDEGRRLYSAPTGGNAFTWLVSALDVSGDDIRYVLAPVGSSSPPNAARVGKTGGASRARGVGPPRPSGGSSPLLASRFPDDPKTRPRVPLPSRNANV